MLRSSFIVFLAGWITWFWLDKPARAWRGPRPPDDSMLGNFQAAFDLLRAGYPGEAFVFIWQAHYLLLSVLGGLLLSMMLGSVMDSLRRRRLANMLYPRRRAARGDSGEGDENGPGSASTPAGSREQSGSSE